MQLVHSAENFVAMLLVDALKLKFCFSCVVFFISALCLLLVICVKFTRQVTLLNVAQINEYFHSQGGDSQRRTLSVYTSLRRTITSR